MKMTTLLYIPNWFEWLDVGVAFFGALIGVLVAFWIANRTYKKEERRRKKEKNELVKVNFEFFRKNLKLLSEASERQLRSLDEYRKGLNVSIKEYKIGAQENLQSEFLNYVNIIYLYDFIKLKNEEKINNLNVLLAKLSVLKGFNVYLSNCITESVGRINYYNEKMSNITKLLHPYSYNLSLEKEDFKNKYIKLQKAVLENKDIVKNNVIIDDKLLIDNFVQPLIILSFECEEYKVNSAANEVYAAYLEKVDIVNLHIEEIGTITKNLKATYNLMNNFLETT